MENVVATGSRFLYGFKASFPQCSSVLPLFRECEMNLVQSAVALWEDVRDLTDLPSFSAHRNWFCIPHARWWQQLANNLPWDRYLVRHHIEDSWGLCIIGWNSTSSWGLLFRSERLAAIGRTCIWAWWIDCRLVSQLRSIARLSGTLCIWSRSQGRFQRCWDRCRCYSLLHISSSCIT